MKHSIPYLSLFLVACSLSIGAGAPFRITSSSVGGGGIRSASSDGRFALSGTVGQPEAGAMSGGRFSLTGGFWFETPPGDCNENGAIGLSDFGQFTTCWMGPGESINGTCTCFDVHADQAIDLADFAEMQNNFAGE